VPEPDILLHFLIQLLKILNQVLKNLIQRLIRGLHFQPKFSTKSMARPAKFLKQNNRVSVDFAGSSRASGAPPIPAMNRGERPMAAGRPCPSGGRHSRLKDRQKLHNGLASAGAVAVL
jgi:hypothetical protein